MPGTKQYFWSQTNFDFFVQHYMLFWMTTTLKAVFQVLRGIRYPGLPRVLSTKSER